MEKLIAYPVEFYRTKVWKQWRWRVKAYNGNIIAASSESFWNRMDCERNAALTAKALEYLLIDFK